MEVRFLGFAALFCALPGVSSASIVVLQAQGRYSLASKLLRIPHQLCPRRRFWPTLWCCSQSRFDHSFNKLALFVFPDNGRLAIHQEPTPRFSHRVFVKLRRAPAFICNTLPMYGSPSRNPVHQPQGFSTRLAYGSLLKFTGSNVSLAVCASLPAPS